MTGKGSDNPEPLECGDENIHSAVGQIYLFYNLGHSSNRIEIFYGNRAVVLAAIVLEHGKSKNTAALGQSFLYCSNILMGYNHQRGKDAGENRLSRKRDNKKPVRQHIL